MLYAAPSNAPSMLVLDTATGAVYGVSTEDFHTGANKWAGITSVGARVYAAPADATSVLVTESARAHSYFLS